MVFFFQNTFVQYIAPAYFLVVSSYSLRFLSAVIDYPYTKFLRIQETRNYLNENTLSYVYAKNDHNLNALVGATFQKYTSYLSSITQEQITNEAFGMSGIGKGSATPVVTASQGENAMISYLGRINYNYASKYYVTASMRTDGSSKFSPDNR